MGRTNEAVGLEELRPSSPRRRLVCALVVWGIAVLVCGLLDLRGFGYLEQYFSGLRLAVYSKYNVSLVERARQEIVLVAETNKTFETLPDPVPRSYHAKLIRDLKRLGAKVIAFDVWFDQPRPEDAELAAAARDAGNVVWGSYFNGEGTPEQELVPPVEGLRVPGTTTGHTQVPPQTEDHPAVEGIEPVIMNGDDPVPALSVQVVARVRGGPQSAPRREPGGWRIGSEWIPTDREGLLRILFLEAPEQLFPTIPYEQVDEPFYASNHFFADKIVLIGNVSTVAGDYHSTPAGDMWGTELHAHAIATLLSGRFIRQLPPRANLCVLGLLTALVCLPALVWRLRWAGLAGVLLVAGCSCANFWLFARYDLRMHLVAPTVGMVLGLSGVLLQRGLIEEGEKRRVRGMLRRYLSPQTAEYVLANPDACVLGGKRVEATVLFSDIRGFTTLSESLSPEAVVACLNEYLGAMTDVVFRHEGTVDKYGGDCIMALFGVPVPCPDHAARAVATAIDMQTALLGLQSQWRQRGAPVLDIGIGVHTGDMVVGNIGSRQRVDFTVIGDAVNLASRVESLNKDLGTRILITEATHERVKGEVEVRGPLTARVPGREQDVVVYEVVGWMRTGG
jgi:adenylate cyclase